MEIYHREDCKSALARLAETVQALRELDEMATKSAGSDESRDCYARAYMVGAVEVIAERVEKARSLLSDALGDEIQQEFAPRGPRSTAERRSFSGHEVGESRRGSGAPVFNHGSGCDCIEPDEMDPADRQDAADYLRESREGR